MKTPSKRVIQKTAEVTGDLIGNKIFDKITKGSKTSPQRSSSTAKSKAKNIKFDKEILKDINRLQKGNKLLMSLD